MKSPLNPPYTNGPLRSLNWFAFPAWRPKEAPINGRLTWAPPPAVALTPTGSAEVTHSRHPDAVPPKMKPGEPVQADTHIPKSARIGTVERVVAHIRIGTARHRHRRIPRHELACARVLV